MTMTSPSELQSLISDTFVAAIIDATHTMCATKSTMARAFQRIEPMAQNNGVCGIIGLAGHWTGSVGLHVPTATACALIQRMTGVEFPELNADVADGIGELSNIIAGSTKCELRQKEIRFEISLPKVAFGTSFSMTQDVHTPCLAFEFHTDVGRFQADVSLMPAADPLGNYFTGTA